jgi:hypothetical protein
MMETQHEYGQRRQAYAHAVADQALRDAGHNPESWRVAYRDSDTREIRVRAYREALAEFDRVGGEVTA